MTLSLMSHDQNGRHLCQNPLKFSSLEPKGYIDLWSWYVALRMWAISVLSNDDPRLILTTLWQGKTKRPSALRSWYVSLGM